MKLKHKRKFGWYFIRVFMVLIFMVFICFGLITSGTYKVNKTVGWAWDISNFAWWLDMLFPMALIILSIAILSYLLKKSIDFFNK
jgi:hypothetical protein